MRYYHIAVLVPLFLYACALSPLPDVLPLQVPDDPAIGTGYQEYRSVIGPYENRQPTEPKSWRKLNENQSPEEGGAL